MTVHVVVAGGALCGKPGVPGDWGGDHRWVPLALRHEATCPICKSAAFMAPAVGLELAGDRPKDEADADMRARELIERADRGEGRTDIKLVADYLRRSPTTIEAQGHQPPKLGEAKREALAGLFAAEGRTLLQLLFGWRGQGSLVRWSTGPSKALALFADYLQREYPRACTAAGTKDLDFTDDHRELEP